MKKYVEYYITDIDGHIDFSSVSRRDNRFLNLNYMRDHNVFIDNIKSSSMSLSNILENDFVENFYTNEFSYDLGDLKYISEQYTLNVYRRGNSMHHGMDYYGIISNLNFNFNSIKAEANDGLMVLSLE